MRLSYTHRQPMARERVWSLSLTCDGESKRQGVTKSVSLTKNSLDDVFLVQTFLYCSSFSYIVTNNNFHT